MNDRCLPYDVEPSSEDGRNATYIVCNMHINGIDCSPRKFWHNSKALVQFAYFASTKFKNGSSTDCLNMRANDQDVLLYTYDTYMMYVSRYLLHNIFLYKLYMCKDIVNIIKSRLLILYLSMCTNKQIVNKIFIKTHHRVTLPFFKTVDKNWLIVALMFVTRKFKIWKYIINQLKATEITRKVMYESSTVFLLLKSF